MKDSRSEYIANKSLQGGHKPLKYIQKPKPLAKRIPWATITLWVTMALWVTIIYIIIDSI